MRYLTILSFILSALVLSPAQDAQAEDSMLAVMLATVCTTNHADVKASNIFESCLAGANFALERGATQKTIERDCLRENSIRSSSHRTMKAICDNQHELTDKRNCLRALDDLKKEPVVLISDSICMAGAKLTLKIRDEALKEAKAKKAARNYKPSNSSSSSSTYKAPRSNRVGAQTGECFTRNGSKVCH